MTREDLNEMEKELLEHLAFAESVQANTKTIKRNISLVRLAKIGLETSDRKTMSLLLGR